MTKSCARAWMSSEPETSSKLKNTPCQQPSLKTLRMHAEHNGETDLCKFLQVVLMGCKADDWWNSKAELWQHLRHRHPQAEQVHQRREVVQVGKLHQGPGRWLLTSTTISAGLTGTGPSKGDQFVRLTCQDDRLGAPGGQ